MTRHTITVADSRGIKVRTAVGKSFYVVIPNGTEKAKVITRTDSSLAAFRAMNRWQDARVWAHYPSLDPQPQSIVPVALERRAQREKKAIADAKRHGYKHEAF